jgi:hypothetical protein
MSLDAVDGAYTALGNKLGAAVMDTVETRARASENALTVEDVAAWHDATAGHLYQSDEIRSHMVVVKPVQSLTDDLQVIDVGEKSLAWAKVQASSDVPVCPKDVERFVSTSIAEQDRGNIMRGYVETHLSQGRQYYDRKLLHMSNNGQAIVTTYLTMLMAGRWHDDAPVVWNFSTEISSRVASDHELAELQGYLDHQ